MKIIVLEGSPHKKGSSNMLAEKFIKGAEEAGHTVEVLDVAHMDMHPCLGCEHCGMNGEMKKIADKYGVEIAQIPVAWAISKGTLPIIGVTKIKHVEDAAKAADIMLTAEEMEQLERVADGLSIDVIRYWEKVIE